MDIWPWLSSLPSSPLRLVSSPSKTLLLKSDHEQPATQTLPCTTVSICVQQPDLTLNTLWLSQPFPPNSPSPFLLQLLREIGNLSPSTEPVPLPSFDDGPDFPDLCSYLQFPNLVALLFLCRMLWLCAFDAPQDVGALYFRLLVSDLSPALECRQAMRELLRWAGTDWEILFMRTLGYILAKLCILHDTSLPSDKAALSRSHYSFSYTTDEHGLWAFRGYAPVAAMAVVHRHGHTELEAKEPVLRYALAHQNLEAVFQFEHQVCFDDERFIRLCVRVDNLRVKIWRLKFGGKDRYLDEEVDERHFPSRVRLWLGPDPRSGNSRGISGLSLGKSTENPVREVEKEQTMKGKFAKKSIPAIEAESRTAVRAKTSSWRWEQEAEGNAAVFEGILCENSSGAEVASWKGAVGAGADPRKGMRRRYSGQGRALSKSGGVVVAGDAFGQWVSWRVGREMEGEVLKWRIGGRVWVSYCANEVKSGYFETRAVEWQDEVHLHLVR